ncbi:MAG TPA: tetratricopeptide repeat protein [bacterium]|nr:tetratricopeptide repeat protein [bacterium]
MVIRRVFNLLLILVFIPAVLYPAKSEDPLEQAARLFKNKKYEEAVSICERVKVTYPGSDWDLAARILAAKIHEKSGAIDRAVTEFSGIISKFPEKGQAEEAYFSVGRLRAGAGRPKEAASAFELYLKKYPRGAYAAAANFNIASIYRDAGDSRRALSYFETILKKYPNEPWFYSWSAIYSGHIYMKRKDYDRAVESYLRVIDSDENRFLHTLSSLHRGQASLEKKDYRTAAAIFQNILKTTNHFSEEALYGLGRAQYLNGDFVMARETLMTIVQMFPAGAWRVDAEKRIKAIDQGRAKKGEDIK